MTNDLGLRGAPVAAEKEPGELRVLCLGDSVTFGLGLSEGDTVPERLQAALAAAPPEGVSRVTVLNGGVAGYSSVQGERLYRRLERLGIDVVVFWFGINDSKPMHGVPDLELRPRSGGAPGWWRLLGGLRVAQLAAWIARPDDRVRRPRVSAEEFGEIVARFTALASGGPRVVFVRFPERMETTLAQMREMSAAAEDADADEVRAHPALLTPYAPAPADFPRRLAIEERSDRTLAVFGVDATATHVVSLEEFDARLERLDAWYSALRGLLQRLPATGALTYRDLFGHLREDEVFVDNCHLTPEGARAAADALAAVIREPAD